MYPDSLLWWLGGVAVLLGVLGLVGMLAWWVDHRYQRHIEKRHGAPRRDEHSPDVSSSPDNDHGRTPDVSSSPDNDHGRTAVWVVFEVLSAILVVTSLLVAIYSDSQVLRAVAGIALIVLVAAATTAVMSPDP